MSTNGPTKIDSIIERLDRMERKQDDQGEKIYAMHGAVSKLEVKSSIFGILGGILVATLAWLKGHLG